MVQASEILKISPPGGLESVFRGKPPPLWGFGDPAILNDRLLGVISARQIDSDLALKSSQLLRQLASSREVAFVGGWHSPLEEEALHILLAGSVPIIFCTPKALNRCVLPPGFEKRLSHGQALLLTHCSPKARRISRNAAIRRNQLVMGLASALLVLSAPGGSATLSLAKAALRHGKPVLTIEHRVNKELLASEVLPATFDNIQTALG
jgi:predicted Rossmann fold nucleotide-binding protein DprA/Smf involved in DNA uptake